MPRSGKLLAAALFSAALALAQTVPHLRKSGTATQLIVGGEPFLMLAGEVHNSSASAVEFMRPIWNKLEALHLNTVIGTASWELVEPEEGRFDFTLVDAQIEEARKRNIRLVLIWFGSWKNTSSSYVPLWVKSDPKRFPLSQTRNGGAPSFLGLRMDALSPFGEASAAADARAFGTLMKHIRETDPEHTVIMMQVENETGLLGDSRDRSPLAEAEWSRPVPALLLDYLRASKARLLPEVTRVWGRKGFRTSGTWREVFGDDEQADELFMAWNIGRYVGKVVKAGKAELPLPMYVNAWLGPQPHEEQPGQYPSGGPVAGVMDIWRAAAPDIDLFAPDIYVADFERVCESYTRSGNPLFIPEARASVSNLLRALGRHNALGYSPFGVEDLEAGDPLGAAYQLLGNMAPLLAGFQAEGRMTAVVEGRELQTKVSFGGYSMTIRFGGVKSLFEPSNPAAAGEHERPGYGLIVSLAPDELLFIGSGLLITMDDGPPGSESARIGTIDEGRFEKGKWVAGRRLNGDESSNGNFVLLGDGAIQMRKVRLYRSRR